MDLALDVKDLRVSFAGRTVIDGIDIAVPKGSVTAVIGPSGCGKSVTLRAVLGLVPQATGSIEVLGRPMNHQELPAIRRRMGVLFQQGALFSSLSVLENIAFPMQEHTAFDAESIKRIAKARIEMVGLPASAQDLYPSELSGGMIKRAALARALALDPQILLLDEPTAGLDPIGADGFDALILNLRDWLGLTVYMITHDLDSIGAIADRLIAMSAGKVIAAGPTLEVARMEHPWLRSYFDGPRARRLMEG